MKNSTKIALAALGGAAGIGLLLYMIHISKREFTYSFNDGKEAGLEFYDYQSDEKLKTFGTASSGASWNAVGGALKVTTSGADWSLVAVSPPTGEKDNLKYLDANNLSLETKFLIDNFDTFNQVTFVAEVRDGQRRYGGGVQYVYDFWEGAQPRWRIWEAFDHMQSGVPGAEGNGYWVDIPLGNVLLEEHVLYTMYLELNPHGNYTKMTLAEAGTIICNYDLSLIQCKPNPPEDPANLRPPALAFALEVSNLKGGATAVYFDNVVFRAS